MRKFLFIISFIISYNSYSQQIGEQTINENPNPQQNNQSQRTILDDSSKVIYSLKTTKYLLKEKFSDGDSTLVSPDSSLTDIEKVYDDEINHFTYQSLGNIGTPLYNIFSYYDDNFLLSSGINSVDNYYLTKSVPKFYNSRSPFIDLSLFFGGNGRSLVDFIFTRNINENWNIGLDIHRISSDKQISPSKNKGDKNISSSLFKIFSYHSSKNKRLTFYSDFVTFKYNIFGYGGVSIDPETLPLEFYTYDDFQTRLSGIENIEQRNRFNVFFNYKILNGLEVYNDFNYNNQRLFYSDENLSLNSGFYDNFFIDNNKTSDSLKFKTLNNKIGLKGSLKSIRYNIYANFKNINYRYTTDNESSGINRLFVGANFKYLKNKIKLDGDIKIKSTGDYSLRGNMDIGFLNVSYFSGLHEPNLIFSEYSGNHHNWNNDFNSTFINVLDSRVSFINEKISFSPFFRFITVNDHIYLSEEKIPVQYGETIINNQFGINFKISLFNEIINIDNRYTYNILSEEANSIINVPKHLNYSRVYFTGKWFKNTIPVQFGLNMYYRSKYFGNAYEPSLQSYYVQNSFELQEYFRYNIFFNMQVKNLRIFLKMTHFNQFDRFEGYFVTPYYPAQKKVLDLGVRWYFFN